MVYLESELFSWCSALQSLTHAVIWTGSVALALRRSFADLLSALVAVIRNHKEVFISHFALALKWRNIEKVFKFGYWKMVWEVEFWSLIWECQDLIFCRVFFLRFFFFFWVKKHLTGSVVQMHVAVYMNKIRSRGQKTLISVPSNKLRINPKLLSGNAVK